MRDEPITYEELDPGERHRQMSILIAHGGLNHLPLEERREVIAAWAEEGRRMMVRLNEAERQFDKARGVKPLWRMRVEFAVERWFVWPLERLIGRR
jgi:hypothetical protein